MKWHLKVCSLIFLASLAACASSRKPVEVIDLELTDLDTLYVEAEKPAALKKPEDFRRPAYQAAAARTNDLIHTRLDLRFDWQEERVIGTAYLTLQPYFLPVNSVTLDAKDLDIEGVYMDNLPLSFFYDDRKLGVQLPGTVERGVTYQLEIRYSAQPATSGGSAAITSDQGLFFINPRGEEGDKPRQIWTQGETEWNSRWFPTIDQPNERCTQEMYLTVDSTLVTLSNGLLIEQKANTDGTRTDYWRMDQPHAPYLFMLAVGEFAVVREEWQGKQLAYYVEPEYAASAGAIFQHTPEMLSFFSDKLDYPYPWDKYAQIVVRDYVSGAMENTTASVFGQQVQKHRQELIDDNNDYIVAHELIHHWFGNLLTCESWANLPLNEGFANYGEYLWLEHKYGRDAADYHLWKEQNGYLGTSGFHQHPLIHFGYSHAEDMFDAHSYNKAGAILHMLRRYLGDEVFFAGIQKYIKDNAFGAVESHHLRLALEAVSGQDLNWFFNQWFFEKGYPELEISYDYDATRKEAMLTIEQTQNPDRNPPIFVLPVAVDVYSSAGARRWEIRVDQRRQTFRFPVAEKPRLILFDADRSLLMQKQDHKTPAELYYQFHHAPRFLDRFEVLQELEVFSEDTARIILEETLLDSFWLIRRFGLVSLPLDSKETVKQRIRQLAAGDPNALVRAVALQKLGALKGDQVSELARNALEKDSAFVVIGAAIQVLQVVDPEQTRTLVRQLEGMNSTSIREAIAAIYAESGDPEYLSFFERYLEKPEGYSANTFYDYYGMLARSAEPRRAIQAMEKLCAIATDQVQSPFRRLAAYKTINDLRNNWQAEVNRMKNKETKQRRQTQVDQLVALQEAIRKAETNAELKRMYQQFRTLKQQ